MSQLAKTIYFSDYPRTPAGPSGLTIPFPEPFRDAFASVANLSSYAIRKLIGYDSFVELETDARRRQTRAATYARDLLLKGTRLPGLDTHADNRTVQGTFQGGKGSPLHEWYPYLEGYSPDFVNSLIDRFAPNAASILDPFCGSGTTALMTVIRDRLALYAEINPLCRFIIEAKLLAVKLSVKDRDRLSAELERISVQIEYHLAKARPDAELRRAFAATFGSSEFFDSRSFDNVLRLRVVADKLAAQDTLLGRFFVTAVLRSLVPGSLLIRRGDLRFRTKEELKRNPPRLIEELRTSLKRIASDLHDAPCQRKL